MPKNKEFLNRGDGMSVGPPADGAKHFIAAVLRLYPEQLIEWLAKKDEAGQEMVKVDVKIYDGDNPEASPLYLEVNNYVSAKPDGGGDGELF
jgi:hypothetical protein